MALGIGLLIGAERERRKRQQDAPAVAGIRTFSLAALAGALALLAGGGVLLAVVTVAVAAFTAVGYWRTRGAEDPGLTTEIALVATVLLGALAVRAPQVAAAAGVVVAILLAARTPLHRFVDRVLTEDEVGAALVLAAATLVVLPLLPDRPMGPFGALNPRSIWMVVILVLGIGAAGHIAVRALGARFGLPVAGLASGFVSSTATIGAMGAKARTNPQLLSAAAAGAVLSTVATVIQMAAVVAAVSPATLRALAAPLACAGLVAVIYGAVFTLRAVRDPVAAPAEPGRAFSLRTAALFALTLSVVLVGAAALRAWFGDAGTLAAAGLAGFADAHAAAVSMASLAHPGEHAPAAAVVPILAGLTTNTVSKLVFAVAGGGRAFALRVIPGLILVAAAAWCGLLAGYLLA